MPNQVIRKPHNADGTTAQGGMPAPPPQHGDGERHGYPESGPLTRSESVIKMLQTAVRGAMDDSRAPEPILAGLAKRLPPVFFAAVKPQHESGDA